MRIRLIISLLYCLKIEFILVHQYNGRPKVNIGEPIKKHFKNYFRKYVVKHKIGMPILTKWLNIVLFGTKNKSLCLYLIKKIRQDLRFY